MDTQQRLDQVGDRYKAQGYRVIVNPSPNDLPPFAKDFQVEILASRSDGNVLVSVKKNPSELQADSEVPRYAEVTNEQPGWRLDLLVMGPDLHAMPENQDAKEPAEEEIRQS
jgi:hypothetical protein